MHLPLAGTALARPRAGATRLRPCYVYDYSHPAVQAHWASSLAAMASAAGGGIAGFFIDGPSSVDGWTKAPTSVTTAARASWKQGLNATLHRLRSAIGVRSQQCCACTCLDRGMVCMRANPGLTTSRPRADAACPATMARCNQ